MLKDKIWSWEKARKKRHEIQLSGKKLVFTNGCFDILHAGHIHYLSEAAQLGDLLIVGLNSDSSVQTLDKSPARPLQNQDSRALVMAALEFVHAVVVFEQSNPQALIEWLTPDILVKGSDYTLETIVGAQWVIDHGGMVKTLEFIPGYSTTLIEQKILNSSRE